MLKQSIEVPVYLLEFFRAEAKPTGAWLTGSPQLIMLQPWSDWGCAIQPLTIFPFHQMASMSWSTSKPDEPLLL